MHLSRQAPILLAAALSLAALGRAGAQQSAATAVATVQGVVYDSSAARPLADARVELVREDDPGRTPLHTTTDAAGHFVLTGVPDGRYLAGFEHPRLDSLGIAPPVRRATVVGGRDLTLPLAIPSPGRLRDVLCAGDSSTVGSGVLVGMVVAAHDRQPLSGGTVTARWIDFVIDSGRIRREPQQASAASGSGGWFALCGLPPGADVLVQATHGADSSGVLTVGVAQSGIAVLPIAIGPGFAEVTGAVLRTGGQPLADARVSVRGTSLQATTDANGHFTIPRVPIGTQTVETHRVGYYPDSRPVTLSDAGVADTVHVTLSTLRSVLDTVRVTASRVYDRNLQAFADRRRRAATGYFVDRDQIARLGPVATMDALRVNATLQIVPVYSDGQIDYRVRTRGGDSILGPTTCLPNVWIDGVHVVLERSLEELNMLLQSDEIAGIEIYDAELAPPEFTWGESKCSSIVIWRAPAIPKR